MTLLLNEDQRELQRSLRAMFEKQSDSKRVRAVHEAAGSLCLDGSELGPRRERLRSVLEGGRGFGSLGADRLARRRPKPPEL